MLKSIIRICILAALIMVALVGVLSFPMENSTSWFTDILISKSIGVAAIYALCKLYVRWAKTDKLISAYYHWCLDMD
jgi:hypothetical protein